MAPVCRARRGHGLGGLARQLAGRRRPVEADGREDLGEVAGHDTAAKHLLRPREGRNPRGDLPAGEALDDRQRTLTARQLAQDDPLQGLIVLARE